jgi:hypothetical protein
MTILNNRIEREKTIVGAMIELYCHKNHSTTGSVCSSCSKLQDYVKIRLMRCVFGNAKPVCKDCTVHCYSSFRREQIIKIMRWSGPRMVIYHPLYALLHFVDNVTAGKFSVAKPDKRKISV